MKDILISREKNCFIVELIDLETAVISTTIFPDTDMPQLQGADICNKVLSLLDELEAAWTE